MKSIILRYGLISAAILLGTGYVFRLIVGSHDNYNGMMIAGFASMLLAFTMVYVGIRAARLQQPTQQIAFRQALFVGLMISLFATAAWIISWEITMATSMPDFIEKYTAHELADLRASGASAEEVLEATNSAKEMVTNYANPFYRIALTATEILPIGLVIAIAGGFFESRKKGNQESIVKNPM